ncbi:MAG: hypothetical protein ACRDDY_04420 [Clostridium sp.]|uniref:hypothetical protein n=1 Tax=Clostridium sp. TaxID=1506 RepID=UPI003EE79DDC
MKFKKIVVSLSILGIAVVLVGCGKTDIEKIGGNIEKDNYVLAIKEFEKLTDEEEKNKIEEQFKNKAIDIKNRYINEEIEKVQAVEWLNELRLVKEIEVFIDSVTKEVNEIYESRK